MICLYVKSETSSIKVAENSNTTVFRCLWLDFTYMIRHIEISVFGAQERDTGRNRTKILKIINMTKLNIFFCDIEFVFYVFRDQ